MFFLNLKLQKEVIDRNTVLVNKLLLTGTLSNVHRCWLVMLLGAGVLCWVLACRTIEKKETPIIIITLHLVELS